MWKRTKLISGILLGASIFSLIGCNKSKTIIVKEVEEIQWLNNSTLEEYKKYGLTDKDKSYRKTILISAEEITEKLILSFYKEYLSNRTENVKILEIRLADSSSSDPYIIKFINSPEGVVVTDGLYFGDLNENERNLFISNLNKKVSSIEKHNNSNPENDNKKN